MPKYLVSACLAGENVRYDGKNCLQQKLKDLVKNNQAIMICPEVMGGLATPRLPAEIVGGSAQNVFTNQAKILDASGQDVTEEFLKGAYKALEIAKKNHITHVILKENSPSCGSHFIYDGTFQGQKTKGMGLTASLFQQHGFQVLSENEFLHQLDQ